jgi:hypothetical protein
MESNSSIQFLLIAATDCLPATIGKALKSKRCRMGGTLGHEAKPGQNQSKKPRPFHAVFD